MVEDPSRGLTKRVGELLSGLAASKARDAKWLAAAVARMTLRRKPNAETIRDYLRGTKLPSQENLKALLDVLEAAPDQREEVDQAFKAADAAKKDVHSLADQPFGKRFQLGFLKDPFAPFTGTDDRFVDRFLARALGFAGFDLHAPQEIAEFDFDRRVEMVESREADLVVNLETPSRLRKLEFFTTPIRVSLNGVALRAFRDVDAMCSRLLGARPDSGPLPSRILTIHNEVGDGYLQRLMGDRLWMEATRRLKPTLDPPALARDLTDLAKEQPTILFCDEVTALRVLRALDGNGQLLFPLSTDMSILSSQPRCGLPAHILGIGYRRPHGSAEQRRRDADDARLLQDIFTTFLRLEVETTAIDYHDLYDKLVDEVNKCLRHNPVFFVDGVRRVDATGRETATIRAQTARAYARRCLHLSLRAAEAYQAGDPWLPVLRRTRERIAQVESRRRVFVKASLIEALRRVVGVRDDDESLTAAQFKESLGKHAEQVVQLIEQDLEMRLPGGAAFIKECERLRFDEFLSALQERFALASGNPIACFVRLVSPEELRRDPLVTSYNDVLRNADPGTADAHRYADRMKLDKHGRLHALRAVMLGETAGVCWMTEQKDRGVKVLRLVDLRVADPARNGFVTQLLIGKSIERAVAIGAVSVVIQRANIPQHRLQWFRTMGFSEADDKTALRYQLFTFAKERSPLRQQSPGDRSRNQRAAPYRFV